MPSSETPPEPVAPEVAARRSAMALAGAATLAELEDVLARAGLSAEAEDLRVPETGLVMTRGRIGGDGRAFNFGEATVTRAAVRLPGGETGFAYHLGRDRPRARLAAILDAHWQNAETRPAVDAALAAVAARRQREAEGRARRVAATRVNFFTLARGED
ncbi:phosphonate C-P lyase system protein PhnG [Methylobacterium dankookense]|uniref:Alpha-D-ribose 1-methylphosphonate 5-triphosphate synthase subunit PhnG n=1 Tax=Methylobacterium dankookense TaxID=560405 RepID=A0A564FX49_9HYPH|nr:phosphonate C-P lyase system protein PhnG [Methylobacterium dankookense]GJD54973.1 Alpha-D-ribose 1-methylphosphonate 5-triphosphate synthase subunit PhnG [Methylobacterium dankookense]VUF11971.1 Alpha-D-ribose 1-methylphosphonate 5-triphosphate synthase subunit PhnG [Methylobacterium dankookense]